MQSTKGLINKKFALVKTGENHAATQKRAPINKI